MDIQLSFSVDEPPEFHTLNFHYKQAFKKKLYNRSLGKSLEGPGHGRLNELLRRFLNIPDTHSLIIMPSENYFQILALLRINDWIHGTHGSTPDKISGKGNLLSAMKKVYLNEGMIERQLDELDFEDMFMADTDPFSGHFLDQDLVQHFFDGKNRRLHVDYSGSLFSRKIDFENSGSALFNTFWLFGFYPGFYIWIVHEEIKDVMKKRAEGWFGMFNTATSKKRTGNNIMIHPETDRIRLYVFSEMINDLLQRDLTLIRNETKFKSIILYNALTTSSQFDPLISDEKNRSQTILSAKALMPVKEARNLFKENGIKLDHHKLPGYGNIIRFGNFPVHSKEQAGRLADLIESA